MSQQTDNDSLIFSYLYELPYYTNIEINSETDQQANSLIDNQLYSDINIQDEDGNTFFHYASLHNNFGMMWKLLNLKANPYIKNNKERNGFQVSKHIYSFWDNVRKKIANFDALEKQGLNFCPPFRQAVFDIVKKEQTSTSLNFLERTEYLDKLEINTIKNQISFTFLFIQEPQEQDFTHLISLSRTKEDNVYLIFSALNCLSFFSKSAHFFKPIENFCQNSELTFKTKESLSNLVYFINYEQFIKTYGTNPVSAMLIDKIFETLVKEDILTPDSYITHQLEEYYHDYPELQAAYLKSKLFNNKVSPNRIKI